MDVGRLRPGELLAATGGAILLIAMLLDWFSEPTTAPTGARTPGTAALNAWQAFGVIDLLLAVVAVGAVAILVLNAFHPVPSVPVAVEALTLVVGLAALLAVGYRALDQPGSDRAVSVEPGLYVGLAAVLVIFYGAYRALRDESPRATPAPAVELRPAPSVATPPKEGPA